jgi:uncharacterized protein YdcH (DUF465 family)
MMITDRLFRIMESHARIDAALRRAEGSAQPDNAAITKLRHLKFRAKSLIAAALERRTVAVA